MLETTKQEMEATQSRSREDRWKWVERTIWTERMLMALGNGVKGYKWFRWPNEYFAKLELFSLEVARAKWRVANQSR